jgi:hypothetical protein
MALPLRLKTARASSIRWRSFATLALLVAGACSSEDVPRGVDPDPGTGGRKATGGRSGQAAQGGAAGAETDPTPVTPDATAPAAKDAAAATDAVIPVPPAAGDAAAADTSTPPIAMPGVDGGPAAPPPVPNPAAGKLMVDGVATWRGDAAGVYTIIHDDVCDASVSGVFTHADPELTKRGLHAGFGAIVQQCVERNQWANLKTLLAHGHDVFSHSWSHPCLGSPSQCAGNGTPSADYNTQITKANQTLEDMLKIKVGYFIFPYDVCGAGGVARVKELGYLGARCGGEAHGVNDANFTDPFANKFDIWGPAYSTYGKAGACAGAGGGEEPTSAPAACRRYVLNHYVDEAIRLKGWANRELHGFTGDPDAWQAMPLADYQAHLDYVAEKAKSGVLWVEGPSPVIRYRFAREACAKPTVEAGVLKFGPVSDDCKKFATPLTYLVSASDGSDPASLHAQQGGAALPSRKLGPGKFAIDADPTKGDAALVP